MNISVKSASDRMAGDFCRVAKSIAASSNAITALEHAEKSRASDRAIEALRVKATSTAATLGDSAWAGDIADDGGAAAGFIDSMRSASLFYRLATRANVFPLQQRVIATAALEVGGAQGESAWLPVIEGSFAPTKLVPRKTGGIVVMSKELADATDPASFAVFRRELQKAAIAAVDTVFVSLALDSVTSSTMTDFLTDIETMMNAVDGNAGASLIFMAGSTMAKKLATVTDDNGARLFPEMGPQGGQIVKTDVLVSDRMTADMLMLVDASGFAVNEGTVDIDQARGATLQMRDDPASTATTMVSMFQTGSVALRIMAGFGCQKTRAGSVAAITLT